MKCTGKDIQNAAGQRKCGWRFGREGLKAGAKNSRTFRGRGGSGTDVPSGNLEIVEQNKQAKFVSRLEKIEDAIRLPAVKRSRLRDSADGLQMGVVGDKGGTSLRRALADGRWKYAQFNFAKTGRSPRPTRRRACPCRRRTAPHLDSTPTRPPPHRRAPASVIPRGRARLDIDSGNKSTATRASRRPAPSAPTRLDAPPVPTPPPHKSGQVRAERRDGETPASETRATTNDEGGKNAPPLLARELRDKQETSVRLWAKCSCVREWTQGQREIEGETGRCDETSDGNDAETDAGHRENADQPVCRRAAERRAGLIMSSSGGAGIWWWGVGNRVQIPGPARAGAARSRDPACRAQVDARIIIRHVFDSLPIVLTFWLDPPNESLDLESESCKPSENV
ncbi:hypothetical protein FB451DRAFT_1370845 [Mycena latifolia]|nr:hypothetical protein FB451DRAFT_1370845 [Mycena latifolia]